MGFVMYLVSLALSIVLFVPAVIFNLYKLLLKPSPLKELNTYFSKVATGRDAYYNVICAELFNAFFIQNGGYHFGKRKETISSALGKNQERKKLTKLGVWFSGILSIIDKDHCLKNIDRTV